MNELIDILQNQTPRAFSARWFDQFGLPDPTSDETALLQLFAGRDNLVVYRECEELIASLFKPRNGASAVDARKLINQSIDGAGVTVGDLARLLNVIDSLAERVLMCAVDAEGGAR